MIFFQLKTMYSKKYIILNTNSKQMSNPINLHIFISEIAIITGDNPYVSKRDFLIDFWKRFDELDYLETVRLADVKSKVSDVEKIKEVCKENGVDKKKIAEIEKKIKESNSVKDTKSLSKLKEEIKQLVGPVKSVEQKKELEKSVVKVANTNFGTGNEKSVLELVQAKIGQEIVKDDIYRKKYIFKSDDFGICIGGKIDGICSDSRIIIEIKNRVRKLFFSLREYEKVQMMFYLFLHNVDSGKLVEAFKTKTDVQINIIDVVRNEVYLDSLIGKIILFGKFFVKFIGNKSLKKSFLKGTEVGWLESSGSNMFED